MPKHTGKSRRRRRIIKGNVDEGLSLSTLATTTLVGVDFDEVALSRAWFGSMEATWSLDTNTAGEGPILVGIAHGDYTDAEIEAVIENVGSWSEGNLVQQEVARRKVRVVGVFPGSIVNEVLNEGSPIKTKLGWIVNEAETLKLWAYNRDPSTLTAGAQLKISGHVWIFPT